MDGVLLDVAPISNQLAAELVLRVIDGDALTLPLSAIGGAVISTLLLLWWKRPLPLSSV